MDPAFFQTYSYIEITVFFYRLNTSSSGNLFYSFYSLDVTRLTYKLLSYTIATINYVKGLLIMLLKLSKLDVVIGCGIAISVAFSVSIICNVLAQVFSVYLTR